MSAYLRGTDVLGAISAIDIENIEITKKIDRRILIGTPIGAALAATGLAFIWKRHRILGGALGLLVAGPAAGLGCGLLLSREDFKKIAENNAKQETLKQEALKRMAAKTEKPT